MPIYEFRCTECGHLETVFKRTVTADVAAPACSNAACSKSKPVVRAISKFARHMTEIDQIREAEAKWGKEVDAAMGPTPDIGRLARRYDRLAADLPPPEEGVGHP
jgi:putative FmdB family regulatory protein